MAITKINTPELFDLGTTNSSLRLPSGDTASRPSNPNTGEWRYNTDDNYVEYWDGTAWFQIDYEAVAPTCTTNTINYPSGTTNTAYYKMSDATDSTLNGYNGTPTNVNFNVQGKFGNAGEFNGSSSLLDASGFNITGDRSISFWVKNNSSANGAAVLNTCNTGSSGTQGILVRVDTSVNKYYLSVSPPASPTPYIGDTSSDWVHIAVVDDSTNYKLYYNGSYVTQTPVQTTREQLSKLRLGKRFDFTQYFSGSIDQIRIFSSALTAANVTSLYNEVQCVPDIVPIGLF